jgi:hypothetical protein
VRKERKGETRLDAHHRAPARVRIPLLRLLLWLSTTSSHSPCSGCSASIPLVARLARRKTV